MSPAKKQVKEVPKPTKKFGGFRPVNDKCVDCTKEVGKGERQELVFDKDNQCRRRCGKCIKKLKG